MYIEHFKKNVNIGQEIEYGTAKFIIRPFRWHKKGEVFPCGNCTTDENGFYIDSLTGEADLSVHICDGTNGTPDLRGRFILGASDNHIEGETGGEETHTLTTEEMPSHNHSASSNNTGAHTHTTTCYKTTASVVSNATVNGKTNFLTLSKASVLSGGAGRASNSAGAHAHTITVNANGGGTAHNNMPPYYVLTYFMQIK